MAQDGEMSESQHPSEEPNAEAERLLAGAASGYSGSTEVYHEPQRSSCSPVTQQGSGSGTSSTPTPPPPLSVTYSNKTFPRDDDCSSRRLAGPSNARNQVRQITGDTSQGAVPKVRRNTEEHFAKPKGGYKVTKKPPYLTKATGLSTSPNVRQRYENIDRNTTRGGNRQSGTKWSTTNIGLLPSPTGLTSRDAEVQVPSAAFNTQGQNVRLPGEQQILLRPGATLKNILANDQKANLGRDLLEAVWRATQGCAERQSGHATAQLPHTPQEELSQADALVALLNKAYQGTSATPTAYQSHLRTSNPNSPTVRKKHDFTLSQQAPLTAHQQRNLPLPSLIPILDPYNLVMLSTSPYQTSPSAPNSPSFLFPGQINEVRHPQITNLVAPPEMQQRSFNLLQGTSSVGQDFRHQLNPGLGGTTVDQNNIPGMADSGLYTSSTLLHTLGIRPAVQGNQFGQQPMPAYSAASHGYMMANTAPQMIKAYVPLPQTVTQGAATNITSQLDMGLPCDRRTDPRTAQFVVQYQAVPPAAHSRRQPTLLPRRQGLQTQMPLAPRPPPYPVLYEQPVPHGEKMAYVQKWLDDCHRVDPREMHDCHQVDPREMHDCQQIDPREMPRPSQAARWRQRAPRGRKGAPNDRSQPVLHNEEEPRDTEADATGATMMTPNVQRTVIPEETQEGHSVEPVVGAPQLRSTAYRLPSRERWVPGPPFQVRSEKTRGAMPGRQRGRKRGGRRGAPKVESYAIAQHDPHVSPQPVSMESFQRQYERGGHYLYGRRGASTSRGNLPSKGASTTFRTSAQAPRPREKSSETHILENAQFVSNQRSLLPRTSSTTCQTEAFKLPHMADQVAKREEVRRDLESPPRDPQSDAHSRLPYSVKAEERCGISHETQSSSHGSEPSEKESSAKSTSQAGPQSPRRRRGIWRKRGSTRKPENALESHNCPLPAQPGTSVGQDHAVHETEDPSLERRNDADESSPEQGRFRVFEPSEPSLFERATYMVSDGDSELDFFLLAPLHISPRNISSPHDLLAPPKDASFSPWSHSRIGRFKDYAICAPSLTCEDALQFKLSTGISFTMISDTSLLEPESIEGIFRLPHGSEEYGVSCGSDDADR